MNDDYLYLTKEKRHALLPGNISENQFWLLVEISSVHSEKVINALRDFLVFNSSRKEACERYNVSLGYFSGALERFQRINMIVSRLASFYQPENCLTYCK